MLLPQAWLRKRWLERALRDYPVYDPPHKVEERLVSREKATENFDYFMQVRQERLAHFRHWLRRYFGVKVTLDKKGVRALNRWGNRYSGLLLVVGPDGHPTDSYFTYEPAWVGQYAGHNVLFDMGIALGEAIIACCPKLHWDVDPISAILPRTANMMKRERGMSFQRPTLTGFDDPAASVSPLHAVYGFAWQMLRYTTTFEGAKRIRMLPHRRLRRNIREELLNSFNAVLRAYLAREDPYKLRGHMPPDQYLKFIDRVESGEGDGDD